MSLMLSMLDPVIASEFHGFFGEASPDGVYYLPLGYHTKHRFSLTNRELIGIEYHSIAFGTFINSFDDRTWYLGMLRTVYTHNDFSLDVLGGLLYGYRGKLSTTEGMPFRNSFLWRDNLNPVITVVPGYAISDHVQLQILLTPLMICGGAKYVF